MTSTAHSQFASEPRPPENRHNGAAGARHSRAAGSETSVPAPGTEPTAALSDAAARELRDLRREMAELRSDYAMLRAMLPNRAGAPGDPGASPPTEAIGIVGRQHDGDATRPAFRPSPRSAPGRGPMPAPPGRQPAPGPATAPRPAPPLQNRPGPNRPAPSPRSFPPRWNPTPAALAPPAAPTAPASPHRPAAAPRAPQPAPRAPRPTAAPGSANSPAQGTSERSTATRPAAPSPRTDRSQPTTAATTALPIIPATDDATTALTIIPATDDATTALTIVPATDATTALTITPAIDSTAAVPVIPATDNTTALPTIPANGGAALRPSTPAPRRLDPRASPQPPAPRPPAPRPTTPRPTAPRPTAPRPTGMPAARPSSPAPITSLSPGTLPATPPTIRLPRIAPGRPAPAGHPAATPAPGRTAPPAPSRVQVPATALAPATSPAKGDAPAGAAATALAALLAEVLKVDKVPVTSHFFDDLGADSMLMAQFCAKVRKRPELPAVSIKDVYRHPTVTALAAALATAALRPAPAGGDRAAAGMAAVLAEVLKVDKVPVTSHFFDDLGADSMLMAQFCAKVRKRPELPTVSIKDVYRHPTITALAGAFGASASPQQAAARPAAKPSATTAPPDPSSAPMSRSKPHFYLCGLLQLLYMLGFPLLMTFVAANGFVWVAASVTPQEIYLRSLAFGGIAFVGSCTLPILLKWTLIGRWKPRQFRVWSLAYLRFWLVRSLIQLNPLARFAGSPVFSVYLRLLGAKIGRGVLIFSPAVPVGTDLFTAGSGTVIRKGAVIPGYRAMDGVIQIGPVTLGRDVYIGETTVLDIGTAMGDGAQLGHSSSLHTGQSVPAGEHWHGSPAEPTTVDYRTVRNTRLSFLRRFMLPLLQILFSVTVTAPLALGLPILIYRQLPQLMALVGPVPPAITTWGFYRDALLLSTVLFVAFLLLGVLLMVTVPRLLRVLVRPGREYRLYGVRYWAHGRIARMTNNRFFVQLLGDSSYIVGYLRGIGYDLSSKVVQTGSNFGSDVQHDNPFLSRVGSGTVVADGLAFINADYSGSHFRVSQVSVGANNFLGNRVAYPAQGRTGDNCLLATKVMVPMDGPVREGVGLLGSPSFEIPRTVDRDHQLDVTDPAELRRKLRRKNWHNTVTIMIFLVTRWVLTSMTTVLTLAAVDLHSEFGLLVALVGVVLLPLTTGYLMLIDLLWRRMMVHRPNGCSIYDRDFRRHERFWKLGADRFPQLFNGTPFKSVIWRMLGAKIGRRVFDDGCTFTERRFVRIGDRCTLNAGSIVQCHSQEDGAFKSDRSTIGAGVTLGVGAFVHYGVTVGDGVLLEPDSFLMKGSDVPAGSRWGGNPAMEIGSSPFDRSRGV